MPKEVINYNDRKADRINNNNETFPKPTIRIL